MSLMTAQAADFVKMEFVLQRRFRLSDGKAQISLECRGCGRCVEICPEKAIILTIEGEENIQDILKRLDNLVDLE